MSDAVPPMLSTAPPPKAPPVKAPPVLWVPTRAMNNINLLRIINIKWGQRRASASASAAAAYATLAADTEVMADSAILEVDCGWSEDEEGEEEGGEEQKTTKKPEKKPPQSPPAVVHFLLTELTQDERSDFLRQADERTQDSPVASRTVTTSSSSTEPVTPVWRITNSGTIFTSIQEEATHLGFPQPGEENPAITGNGPTGSF